MAMVNPGADVKNGDIVYFNGEYFKVSIGESCSACHFNDDLDPCMLVGGKSNCDEHSFIFTRIGTSGFNVLKNIETYNNTYFNISYVIEGDELYLTEATPVDPQNILELLSAVVEDDLKNKVVKRLQGGHK